MAGELILIVEDNEKNRKLERDVLQAKGYRTIEAETGEDGVRLAKEHRPALVLMDIQLPGIDGITALGQLRADAATRSFRLLFSAEGRYGHILLSLSVFEKPSVVVMSEPLASVVCTVTLPLSVSE